MTASELIDITVHVHTGIILLLVSLLITQSEIGQYSYIKLISH